MVVKELAVVVWSAAMVVGKGSGILFVSLALFRFLLLYRGLTLGNLKVVRQ